MDGVRKNSYDRIVAVWISVALLSLLICVTALSAASSSEESLIWIAETQGVQTISQSDGAVLSEIALPQEARSLAIDRQRNTVWVFSGKSIRGFDLGGKPKFTTEIAPPNGQPEFLVLDASDGSAWLAVQSQLYRFDHLGGLLDERRTPQPITDITLDRAWSRLWAAYRGVVEVHTADGSMAFNVDVQGAKFVRALDYDQKLDQVWVVADDSLRRYSTDGELLHQQNNAWFREVLKIAADQHGGLWAADNHRMVHIDQSGTIEFSVEPFAGFQPSAIVDVVSDPADGSAWVASQRRVVHYARDGARINEFAPQSEGGAARLIRQLALETLSLAPRISIASPADNSVLGTSRPEIALAIDGPEPDANSFEFQLNGEIRPFDCAQAAPGYRCMPAQSLPDGQYLLTVTVADPAGNRSTPAVLRFTIDTVAPAIEITSPEDGLLTNQTSVQIAGRVSEIASFTLNDVPKSIQPDGSFSHGPFGLSEGENAFRLQAIDAAGNEGESVLHVTRDTLPPPPPNVEQIQAQQQSDGSVRISGSAGSVEGGSTVTVINTRTGERATTTANPDGSFSTTIAGENGDEIQVYATDGAGNTGQLVMVAVTGDPFSGSIDLVIVSPANGTTVGSDRVMVVIDLRAPLNTGVTVNDVPAAGVPNGSGLRFYVTVPLEIGTNTLIAKATTLDGRQVTKTANVGSTGPAVYRVSAQPEVGIGPQEVTFEISDQLGVGIQEVRYDFDGNGTVDHVTTDPFEPVSSTFTGIGLHTVYVNIVDTNGRARTQAANIVLQDPIQLDGVIRAIWDGMNTALTTGDREAAMRFLSETAREKYGAVFDALMPRMADIINSYSAPQRSYLSPDMAEYGVNRTINGIDRVFLIEFTTNENGQWQVDAM